MTTDLLGSRLESNALTCRHGAQLVWVFWYWYAFLSFISLVWSPHGERTHCIDFWNKIVYSAFKCPTDHRLQDNCRFPVYELHNKLLLHFDGQFPFEVHRASFTNLNHLKFGDDWWCRMDCTCLRQIYCANSRQIKANSKPLEMNLFLFCLTNFFYHCIKAPCFVLRQLEFRNSRKLVYFHSNRPFVIFKSPCFYLKSILILWI